MNISPINNNQVNTNFGALKELQFVGKFKKSPKAQEKLLDAFAGLLARAEARGKEKEEPKKIVKDRFTVAEKIVSIRGYAREHKRFPFEDLFAADMTKSEMINVFLALLELLKLQNVRVEQTGIFQQINVISNEG